jgi:hypothetical protein
MASDPNGGWFSGAIEFVLGKAGQVLNAITKVFKGKPKQ